ncbi:transglutaminaseTgpA domain-containing protein [Lysobacter sp. F6437]|uniref:transglutaminaseTgpA domain-containing protein n=1 Tax=Lysobacter sp. F6437 TaxID=3459296 RepID=UPI00403DAF93
MAEHVPTPTPQLDPGSRRWALVAAAACLLPLLLQLPAALSITVAAAAVLVATLSWRRPMHGLLRAVLAVGLLGTVLVLTNFGIGRDTGCAVLAAMLAIKPAETSTLRDARSLIGFALFAPFGTFLLDQGPLALALGLVGALLALCALQRLADLESGDALATGAGRRLAGIGRLLAIGLPLALAAFWLFPRLGSPMWGVPERALGRPGLSGEMTPGQWIDLIADDTPALRVRFFGATPPTSQMYWRGPVMWHYDGRSWTRSDWLRSLPPAEVQHGPTRWDYEVEIEPTDRRQLVALELPLAAPDGTRLNHDHELLAPRPLTSLTRWRMQSARPLAYEPQLRPVLRRAALQLPAGYNPRTHALARQWRAEAGDDDAAIVQRSLDWVRSEFAYTLDTPLPGRNAVDEFLFDQQAGFCEHYSSAFVVLMRAAGIPSRVVTGYVGGYRNPLGDYWLVRRSDAHAWAEVWLDGRGWVRVDPTAAVAPERIYDTIHDRLPGADGLLGGVFGAGSDWFNAGDWLRRGWNNLVLGFDADRQARMLRPLGIERLDGVRLGLLFALSVLLALLWMAWLSRRGERQPDPVLRAWHALDKRYRRLHLGREPSESALAWAKRVSQAKPELGTELQRLSQRFSDWRYAGDHPGAARALETRQLVRALRAHRPRNGEPR